MSVALVELLVSLQKPALEAGQVGALGAALVVELALHPDLLVLGLEDQLLLLGARLRDDPGRLVAGGLDRLVGDDAAQEESERQTAERSRPAGHDDDDVGPSIPPIQPAGWRYAGMVGGGRPVASGVSGRHVDRWTGDRRIADRATRSLVSAHRRVCEGPKRKAYR